MRWKVAAASLALCAATACQTAAQTPLALRASAGQVGRYERLEFTIDGVGDYANPFDDREVAVDLEVHGPDGKTVVVPAFWTQEYDRQRRPGGPGGQAEWLYPTGKPGWRARYAPAVLGTHACVAVVRDRAGRRRSNEVRFTGTPSKSHGYVRAAVRDPRFLELSDGTPFFAVGQNAAFVRDGYDTASILAKMGRQGANFARIWTCSEDWALALEAPRSAWGRSWDWSTDIVQVPGREGYLTGRKCVRVEAGKQAAVQPTHPVALRAGTRYRLTGVARVAEGASLTVTAFGAPLGDPIATKDWQLFTREFVASPNQWWLDGVALKVTGAGQAWIRGLSLREAAGGSDLLWEADLDRPVTGVYNLVDCFVLDKVVEAAEAAGVRLQLCLLTRDLYMDRLRRTDDPAYAQATDDARRLLRYAVARWGCSTAVAAWEYFNEMDPGVPTDRFHAELARYLDGVDPYRRLRDTSDWADCPRDWRSTALDAANMHWYMRPAEGDRFKDEVAGVLAKARALRKEAPAKPALFAEFGLAKDDWQRSPYMAEDKDCIHLHRALWASALSGLSGTVMPWWWEDLDKLEAYRCYTGVAAFMAGVPVNSGKLAEARATCPDARCRVVGLQAPDRAYLWVCDAQATWWRHVVEKKALETMAGVRVSVEGLSPGAYQVVWVRTADAAQVEASAARVSAGAPLLLAVPRFSGDIACKVLPRQ